MSYICVGRSKSKGKSEKGKGTTKSETTQKPSTIQLSSSSSTTGPPEKGNASHSLENIHTSSMIMILKSTYKTVYCGGSIILWILHAC